MITYDMYHLNRCDAIEFLMDNFSDFPQEIPANIKQVARGISVRVFRDWRFVVLHGGELAFSNCISPCIRACDMKNVFKPYGELNSKQ